MGGGENANHFATGRRVGRGKICFGMTARYNAGRRSDSLLADHFFSGGPRMTRELVELYVVPGVGLALVLFCVVVLILLTAKRGRFSPFFVFRAYLIFGLVLLFGGWMVISPFMAGYGISDMLRGGTSARTDESETPDNADGEDGPRVVAPTRPSRPALPEMSEFETKMLVRDLQSQSRMLRLNAIERLSKSQPRRQDVPEVKRALAPLAGDSDNQVRAAAQQALASLPP